MLRLKDIRKYIAGLGIVSDDYVYIGKLDNKKDCSIGVYHRKADGPPEVPLGGMQYRSYEITPVSLLIHWNKSVSAAEDAAIKLYEKLTNETSPVIGDKEIRFFAMQTPGPVDVGTDDSGIYEYVIWFDIISERRN